MDSTDRRAGLEQILNESNYRYNAELLFDEKQKTILQDIEKAKTELNLLF